MKTLLSVRKIFFTVISASILLLLVTACDKNNDNNNNQPISGLMALNLAPDKAVNISLSGNYISALPISYSNYTGGYYAIYSGTRPVESFDANTGASLDMDSYNFENDQYYSLFVVGANGNYHNIITHDNFDSITATSGQAYVRYINAIADSTDPLVSVMANGSETVNENSSFGNISEFTAVPAGDITINVNGGATIDASRTISVEERKLYTVLLLGIPGSTTASDSLQIRYVVNGTLDQDAAKMSSINSMDVD